jgi:hypothetical protein
MSRTEDEDALLRLYRLAKVTNPDGARRVLRESRHIAGAEIFSSNVLTADESTDMFSAWAAPIPTT